MKKLMLFLYMFVPIVPAIAQEAQRSSEISVSEDGLTSQSVRDLASQLAGNWICYRTGGYDIKRITATREVVRWLATWCSIYGDRVLRTWKGVVFLQKVSDRPDRL